MITALRAELLKITTTRLWWIMLICVVVLGGGYAALPAVIALLSSEAIGAAEPFSDPGTLRSIYNGGNTLSRIWALVVGILSLGGEFTVGLLYGLASVLAGVAVAVPFVLVKGGSFLLDRTDTWRSLVLGVLSIALWTLIGMGIGILIRNMLIALLVGIGFSYILEPILTVLFFIQEWQVPLNLMPSGATNAMLGITPRCS